MDSHGQWYAIEVVFAFWKNPSGFGHLSNKLQGIGAPILVCVSTIQNEQSAFNVCGYYVLFCPFLEFHTSSLYGSGQTYRQNFITQSIHLLIEQKMNVLFSPNKQHTTESLLLYFFRWYMELAEHFGRKCKEIFNSRKGRTKKNFVIYC